MSSYTPGRLGKGSTEESKHSTVNQYAVIGQDKVRIYNSKDDRQKSKA